MSVHSRTEIGFRPGVGTASSVVNNALYYIFIVEHYNCCKGLSQNINLRYQVKLLSLWGGGQRQLHLASDVNFMLRTNTVNILISSYQCFRNFL